MSVILHTGSHKLLYDPDCNDLTNHILQIGVITLISQQLLDCQVADVIPVEQGLQLAARGPNLVRKGQTIGPRSTDKMLKKFITFSLKSIFLH